MTSHRGLSLVEMLVTLAIVVILLALLVPAINKAIYQSDLAACGANLKAVAAGSHAYAGGYGKTYPIPPGGRWGDSRHLLTAHPETDLRPVIKDHINLKQLVCPLSPTISLAVEDAGVGGTVLSSYGYWSGWRYTPPEAEPEAGMFKTGNRWSWGGKSFSVIATDYDLVFDGGSAAGSHPDQEGRMVTESRQEKDGGNYSAWTMAKDNRPRSRIDFNAAFDDGSVRRYGDVEPLDTRMVRVPMDRTSTEPLVNVPVN